MLMMNIYPQLNMLKILEICKILNLILLVDQDLISQKLKWVQLQQDMQWVKLIMQTKLIFIKRVSLLELTLQIMDYREKLFQPKLKMILEALSNTDQSNNQK